MEEPMTRIMTRMISKDDADQRRPGKLTLILAGCCVTLLVACITINVYFPEAAVKELSQQIEEEIEKRAGGDEPSSSPLADQADEAGQAEGVGQEGGRDRSESLLSFVLSFGASTAWAEEIPSPGISNPAIRRIIDSRAARLDEVNRLKDAGVVGESNRALLEIRDLDAVGSLKERAAAQRLVKEENADREQLFKEIAAAEDVDLSQLERIRTTYAETIRDKARPGDWIQLPDGTWKQR
jgi:uncharacterized protein YdbL (DUF1318 family)